MAALPFIVPPSMGGSRTQTVAGRLESALRSAGVEVRITVASDYQAMTRALERNEALAAWGPPVVCAWAEAFGGHALVRCVREGHGVYRAAIVRRKGQGGGVDTPGQRAAWVDRDSMAGYVLAQALLRDRGIRPSRHFSETKFLGSYRAALEAVLDGRADVTSVWASCADASPSRDGVRDLAGPRAEELEILAHTRECPNDAITAAKALPAVDAERLQRALLDLEKTDSGRAVLRDVFQSERFEVPPAGTYRALHETVFKALTG